MQNQTDGLARSLLAAGYSILAAEARCPTPLLFNCVQYTIVHTFGTTPLLYAPRSSVRVPGHSADRALQA